MILSTMLRDYRGGSLKYKCYICREWKPRELFRSQTARKRCRECITALCMLKAKKRFQ